MFTAEMTVGNATVVIDPTKLGEADPKTPTGVGRIPGNARRILSVWVADQAGTCIIVGVQQAWATWRNNPVMPQCMDLPFQNYERYNLELIDFGMPANDKFITVRVEIDPLAGETCSHCGRDNECNA